ncbi:GntR family transcriptional regulator [Roseomonas sp. 18066]|uniref:GntR family transcriptional regulator n=1 Tax=Roseomonas sp. 18066 TaxID=2681412 RepID=UPI001359BFCF|nr:GntR family transcriptional regulator [Roseomonas sp. 18066]
MSAALPFQTLPVSDRQNDRPDDAEAPASVRAAVACQLRQAIVSGRYRAGQRLPERELCAVTGAARSSVREALRQLEAEGLVSIIPHRGPVVRPLPLEEARQTYAARALLEGHVGRLCALHRTPAQLAALDAAMDAMEAAAKVVDGPRVIAANAAFYAAMTEAAGNAVIAGLLKAIHNRLALGRLSGVLWPGRLTESMAENRAILAAIRAGDAAAAEAACIHHIEASAAIALVILAARHGQDEAVLPQGSKP